MVSEAEQSRHHRLLEASLVEQQVIFCPYKQSIAPLEHLRWIFGPLARISQDLDDPAQWGMVSPDQDAFTHKQGLEIIERWFEEEEATAAAQVLANTVSFAVASAVTTQPTTTSSSSSQTTDNKASPVSSTSSLHDIRSRTLSKSPPRQHERVHAIFTPPYSPLTPPTTSLAVTGADHAIDHAHGDLRSALNRSADSEAADEQLLIEMGLEASIISDVSDIANANEEDDRTTIPAAPLRALRSSSRTINKQSDPPVAARKASGPQTSIAEKQKRKRGPATEAEVTRVTRSRKATVK